MVTNREDTYKSERQIMYRIAESLCGTPESNITLYVNYTSKTDF